LGTISPDRFSEAFAPTPGERASLVSQWGQVSDVEWRAAEYVRIPHLGQTM
jgi:hypothetical protein